MKYTLSIALVAALSAACAPAQRMDDASTDAAPTDASLTDAPGEAAVTDSASAALSEQEAADLRFLREEEKLARDVYTALTGQVAMVFANIATSEQRHMDQVLALLVQHGIEDPAAGMEPGRFRDATLQALYTALVAQGSRDPNAALAVGAEIEELDIHDIRRLRTHTARPEILALYDSLELGSRNHLRTFYGRITAAGQTYTPRHLDQASFDAIVSSPREMGGM
jgi:hypothetical protein